MDPNHVMFALETKEIRYNFVQNIFKRASTFVICGQIRSVVFKKEIELQKTEKSV